MNIKRFQSKLDPAAADSFIVLAAQMLAPLRINCSPSDYMKLYSTSIDGLTDIIFVFTEFAKTLGPQPLYNSCQMVSPLVPRLYLLACAASAYMNLIVPSVSSNFYKSTGNKISYIKLENSPKNIPIQSNATTYTLFRDLLTQSSSLCSFKGLFFRDFVFWVLHKYLDGLDIKISTKILTDNFAENTVIAQRWLCENEGKDVHSTPSVHVIFQLLGNAISRIAGLEQLGEEEFNSIVLPQVTQQIILMRSNYRIPPSSGNNGGSGNTTPGAVSLSGVSGLYKPTGGSVSFNPQGYLLDCLIRSFPSSLLHSGIGMLFDTFVRVSDTPLVKLIGSLIIRLTEYMVGNESEDHIPSPSLFEFICKQICSMCVLGLIPPSHALAVSKALLPMAVLIENNSMNNLNSNKTRNNISNDSNSANDHNNNHPVDVLTPWLNCLSEISKEINNKRSEQRTLQGALYSYVQFIKNRTYKGPSLPVFSKIVLSLPEAMHSALADTLLENVISAEISFPLESILPVIKLSNEPEKAAATLYRYSNDFKECNAEICKKILNFFKKLISEVNEELKNQFSTTMVCVLQDKLSKLVKGRKDRELNKKDEDVEEIEEERKVENDMKEFVTELFKITPFSTQLKIRYGLITQDEVINTLINPEFSEEITEIDAFCNMMPNSRRSELFSCYLNTKSISDIRTICEFLLGEKDTNIYKPVNKLILFSARIELLFKCSLFQEANEEESKNDGQQQQEKELRTSLTSLLRSTAPEIEKIVAEFIKTSEASNKKEVQRQKEALEILLKDYRYVLEARK